MTEYLYAVRIGPVQSFIGAARRSRDLWFGSFLLSQAATAVLNELKKSGTLIAPVAVGADVAVDAKHNLLKTAVSIPNVLIAKLNTLPNEVFLRAAAHKVWMKWASAAKSNVGNLVDQTRWGRQCGKAMEKPIFELYFAHTPLTSDYQASLQTLMKNLAQAKLSRVFCQVESAFDIPKSSLDGRTDSVIDKNKIAGLSEKFKAILRITDADNPNKVEHLDAIGLTKRAGTSVHFPSVREIAKGQVVWSDGNEPAEANEQEAEEKCYYAILCADGDNTGQRLEGIDSLSSHQTYSRQLSDFVTALRTLSTIHKAELVYAAGEDVLAFCPLSSALEFAHAMRAEYAKTSGTLSVGLAVVHAMEPMEDALAYARSALAQAKAYVEFKRQGQTLCRENEKNALGLAVHTRGGAPLTRCFSWQHAPATFLADWRDKFSDDTLPDRLPYRLHQLSAIYQPNWNQADDQQKIACFEIEKELEKREINLPSIDARLGQLKALWRSPKRPADLIDELAVELKIAQKLAKLSQPTPKTPPNSPSNNAGATHA